MNLFQGGENVVLLRELMCFAVVEDKPIQPFEQLQQVGQSNVQPEVHCVSDDELGSAHLAEHVTLQRRSDVRQ